MTAPIASDEERAARYFWRLRDAFRETLTPGAPAAGEPPLPFWARFALAYLVTRRAAFLASFRSRAGEIVLAELATHCHALDTTFVIGDPQGSAQLEGRRQVWLKIQSHIHLTEEELRSFLQQEANA